MRSILCSFIGVAALVVASEDIAGSQLEEATSGFDKAWEAFSSQDSEAVDDYKADNGSGARSIAMEILKNCIVGRDDAKEVLEQEFRVVAKIQPDGGVERVFVRGLPKEESTCVSSIASEHSFTAPPKHPYYLGTAMKIRRR